MPEHPIGNFFDQTWNTYQKVVAGNCMFHRELGEALKAVLRERFGDRPFSILDLGCGDAATLVPLLRGLTVKRYRGVDLARAALTLAAENLETLACPVDLEEQDILAALAEDGTYDAIHTSFALHHLQTEQKGEFFRLAARRLNPGGLVLVVDVVREEDETRQAYLQLYCGWLRGTWTAIDGAEKELVCDHIAQNDFPEPYSVLEAQARAAGLAADRHSAREGWHRLLCFSRA